MTRGGAAELREARRRIRRLEQENEVLRRAATYLSQADLPGKLYPLVRGLAASGVPAEVSLQVLGLGRSPYCRWLIQSIEE